MTLLMINLYLKNTLWPSPFALSPCKKKEYGKHLEIGPSVRYVLIP